MHLVVSFCFHSLCIQICDTWYGGCEIKKSSMNCHHAKRRVTLPGRAYFVALFIGFEINMIKNKQSFYRIIHFHVVFIPFVSKSVADIRLYVKKTLTHAKRRATFPWNTYFVSWVMAATHVIHHIHDLLCFLVVQYRSITRLPDYQWSNPEEYGCSTPARLFNIAHTNGGRNQQLMGYVDFRPQLNWWIIKSFLLNNLSLILKDKKHSYSAKAFFYSHWSWYQYNL